MDEQNTQGQRLDKTAKPFRWGIAAAALAGVALVSGYLGLCSWVGGSQRILPNVSISGVDVSGMTAQAAAAAVNQAVDRYGKDASVTLSYKDWSGTISCADLALDSTGSAAAALGAGRGNFISSGASYLSALMGGSSQVGVANCSMNLAQPAFDKLLEEADDNVGGGARLPVWTVDEKQVSLTKGRTGASFDRDMVLQFVTQAADQALAQAVAQNAPASVAVDLAAHAEDLAQSPPEAPDFDALHQEVYVEAKSAEMDPETYEITEHVVGVDFDQEALRAAYDSAAEGETVTVPLTYTQPGETRDGLKGKLFQDVLGQATSKLDNNVNRTSNVRRSADSCNGVIVLPGETFSYNDTTGPRTPANGYVTSSVYVGGKTVQETGGGVCQTSSTIYYAVLHTTLEVVERQYHRFAVGYVPDGMDATVYDGSPDFKFKNNTDYPIKLVTAMYTDNGATSLTVTIYGTNATGRYAVPESSVYDWVAPGTSYVPDSSVPQGTLVLDREQNAYRGRKATTVRHIFEADGTPVETQTMAPSKYATRPYLYHYNPLDGDPASWVDGKPPQPGETAGPETETPIAPGSQVIDPSGTGGEAAGGEGGSAAGGEGAGGTGSEGAGGAAAGGEPDEAGGGQAAPSAPGQEGNGGVPDFAPNEGQAEAV